MEIIKINSIKIFVVSILMLVTACGGGGSGDGHGTVPRSNDTTLGTVAFTSSNDSFAAPGLGYAYTEAIFQSGQSIVDRIVDLMRGGYNADAYRCFNNDGVVEIEFDDNDNNLKASAGDAFIISFTNCHDRVLNDIVDGVIRFDVDIFVNLFDQIHIEGAISTVSAILITDTTQPTEQLSLEANFRYSYMQRYLNSITVETTIEAEATGRQFVAFTQDMLEERVSRFLLHKTATSEDGIKKDLGFEFNMYVDSDLLTGTFTCQKQANTTCFGIGANAIKYTGDGQPLRLDANGDGIFSDTAFAIQFIREFLEYFLFGYPAIEITDSMTIANTQHLFMRAAAAAYHADTSSLVIATHNDPDFGTGLVTYSLDNHAGVKHVGYASVPIKVLVSDDQTRLYVVFGAANIVKKYSLIDDQIVFLNDISILNSYEIIDAEVSPVNANRLAVVYRSTQLPASTEDIVIVDQNANLPNTYRTYPSYSYNSNLLATAFASDGQALFVKEGGTLLKVPLDDNGLTAAPVATGENFGYARNLKRIENRIYLDRQVRDEDLVHVSATGSTPFGYDVDVSGNRAYYASGNTMNVWRVSPVTRLGHYMTGAPQYAETLQMLLTPNSVVLLGEERIYLIEKSSLFPNADTDECDLRSSTTQEGAVIRVIDCPAYGLAYDSSRNLLLAAVDRNGQGVHGQAVEAFDEATLANLFTVDINSDPRRLTLSADKRYLYVASNTGYIEYIDLEDTQKVAGHISLGLGSAIQDPSRVINKKTAALFAIPGLTNSLVVYDSDASTTGCTERSFRLLKNHQFTAAAYFFPSSGSANCDPQGLWSFDLNNRFITFGHRRIETFAVSENAITKESEFLSNDALVSSGAYFAGYFYNVDGQVLNLATLAAEQKFSFFTHSRIVDRKLLIDETANELFFIATLYADSGISIAIERFDLTSGAKLGELSLPPNLASILYIESAILLSSSIAISDAAQILVVDFADI